MPALPRFALALLLLLPTACASAQEPRKAVDDIAKTIEANYYDPRQATAIASELRRAAARGEFDTHQDPRDLATALTDRLQPKDRHFRVEWSPADGPAPPPDGPVLRRRPVGAQGPVSAASPQERRGNYGVRRTEVLPGNVGYIELREFANFPFGQPDAPARRAIEAALQLVSGTDAVIIDLRDNGGGSPSMVGYLSSAFTPKGADIYNVFHSREGTQSEAPADWYPTPRLDVPLYVLTSGRTGSAAEAFAYTMKNARRAKIVGEASGGAANPGGMMDAGNGFRVFVSRGSPRSPITGTNWEGTGVAPDVPAAAADALGVARALALEAVLDQGLPQDEAIDTRWALEALRAESAPRRVSSAPYVGQYGALTVSEREGALLMQRERRPPLTLIQLDGDTFTVAGDPSRRVVFERNASGAVVALEVRSSNGQNSRYRR